MADGMSGIGFGDQTLSDFLRHAGAFVRRRFRVILTGAGIGLALAVLIVAQLETRYESELLLRVEQPARSPIEAETKAATTTEAFVDGQVYIIESTEVLREAVQRAGLTEEPYFQPRPKSWLSRQIAALKGLVAPAAQTDTEPAAGNGEMSAAEAYAVRTLRANLDAYRRGDTELISIKVTANSPRLAARAANAVGAAFEANRQAAQFDRASRVAGWLDDRALELQQKLADAEDAVAAFRIENGLISGEPGTTLSEQQLTQLNTELIDTRAELAQRRAAYSRFAEVVAAGGDVQSLPEVQGSEIVGALRARKLELDRREVELGGASASNPRLSSIREERSAIEAQMGAEVDRILEGLRNEVETLEARERLVVEALAQAGGETGLASRSSVELRELERRAAAYRALYERYLSNAGLVDEGITYLSSGIEIVDPAAVPKEAVYPPRKVFMLFGLLFGGAFGALYGAVREALLPGFMTGRQIGRVTGLPVLACVPQLGANENAQTLTRDAPMSAYAEAIRALRHELAGPDDSREESPVVLLTSSSSGEGKTTLAAALATSAAAGGQNVLLIDADLRRGSLSKQFAPEGEANGPGLSDVLNAGTWSLPVLEPGAGEIDLLSRGSPVASPTDLLASRNLRDYLDDVRDAYDLIVIDGPPVANMADAPILARLADSVAFVVRWNETPRDVVSEAIQRLGDSAATLGVALNGVDLQQAAQYGETYGQYVLTSVQTGPTRHRVPA